MMTDSTVVVTGGGGFLGSHLCERLLSHGARVVAVDNFSTGLRSNYDHLRSLPGASERLKAIEADVVEPWDFWDDLPGSWTSSTRFIFHFASPASPPHYQRLNLETLWVNTIGLRRALDQGRACGARVIFSSTSEIYGDPLVSPQPESYWGNVNTVGPRSCYDEAKRFGEALVYNSNLRHRRRDGLVRIFNTYGPRMNPADGRVVINFLAQALVGRPLTIYGDGLQTRSFCFVDDLIDAILRFANSDLTGPVNIGNDREFTIRELVDTIQGLFPEKALKIQTMDAAIDDPRQRRPDLTLARSALGWSPQVPLRDGLVKMIDWLKGQDLSAL